MKRFEQLIQDAYQRLNIVNEYGNDDPTADNKKQDDEMKKAKQATDKAEDTAHDAGIDAEASKQELASIKTDKSKSTAVKNRETSKKMGA